MKKFWLIAGITLAFSVFAFGTIAFAESVNFGLDETAGAAKLKTVGDVPTIAGNIIGTLLSMISVLFFVLVLYGGIVWMTARGNSELTTKALDTIIAATIGIIIVMGAYALTNFVFKLGGSNGGSGATIQPSTPKIVACCITDVDNKTCKVLPAGTADDAAILFDPPYECVDLSESACSTIPQQCTTIQQ